MRFFVPLLQSMYMEEINLHDKAFVPYLTEVEIQNAKLKKSDSTMAVAVARLEVLNEINKIK